MIHWLVYLSSNCKNNKGGYENSSSNLIKFQT